MNPAMRQPSLPHLHNARPRAAVRRRALLPTANLQPDGARTELLPTASGDDLACTQPWVHIHPPADTPPPSYRYCRHFPLPAAALASALIITLSSVGAPVPLAHAAIQLAEQPSDKESRQRALEQLGAIYRSRAAPPPKDSFRSAERSRIQRAVELLQSADEARGDADYTGALEKYTVLIKDYKDLALSERARVERALMLYQVGRVEETIMQLEDEEVALRGDAQVHAALAAVLYTERPRQVGRAEQQWSIATSFDRRYSDVGWVRKEKGWPPRMVAALEKFLSLG
jgi:tetratricopeptide (TPR) repeat protein